MACSLCLVGIPQVAMIPCGHLCLCELCCQAVHPTAVCPVCCEIVEKTLKVYFTFAGKGTLPVQKLLAVPVKEDQFATTTSTAAILALTDGRGAEEEKFAYVRSIESWMDKYPDAESMPEDEALKFMDLTVPPETHALLALGDDKEYATLVMAECARLWRAMARRLHPDKGSAFWEECDRLERLQRAFAYSNNVQEFLQKHFAKHLLGCVDGVCVDYGLTEENIMFLRIRFQPKQDSAIVVSFAAESEDLEVELQAGVGEISFNDEEYAHMFSDDFEGFWLTHKLLYGPHKGVESRALQITEPVPQALLKAQMQVAREMQDEERRREENRLAAFRRELGEISASLRKRKRGTQRGQRNKRRRQHYAREQAEDAQSSPMCWTTPPWRRSADACFARRPQACLQHDPAVRRYCSDRQCAREHIDTRTRQGAQRWKSIQRALNRPKSERDYE
jgi:hypothetical protein